MGRKRKRTSALTKSSAPILELFDRAEQGDGDALEKMRDVFDAVPGLCDDLGDLANIAEGSMVKLVTESPLVKEALRFKLNALRKEILGPDPTPLEELLARRVGACWLHLHYLESIYAQNLENNGLTGRWSESMQRSIDRAHSRYLSAIKSLVQVRRLLGPVVQVNFAEKQVNIAQLNDSK